MVTVPGRRILVVDDDDGMREAIESLLDVAGYETTSYGSGEALLAGGVLVGALCVVSDFRLPAMSGLDLLAALRARAVPLPMILITAHDTPALRCEAEHLGAAAYLAKPFEGRALLAAIDAIPASAR